jgi:opacity protein-like surface antigen
VTAGPAVGHFNSTTTLLNSAGTALRDTATDDAWHWGMATGAGVEFMPAPNWTVFVEYLYLDFPDVLVNFTPIPPAGLASDARIRTNYGYSAQLARVGLNYKFDGRQATPHAFPPANWAGFYIGANAGGGIAKSDFLDDCFSCYDTTFHTGFGTVGGQLGYNRQWASTVLGLEGDLNWASAKESHAVGLDIHNHCCVGTANFQFDAFGSIRARAGLAVDQTLAYVTAGPAWGHFNSVVHSIGPDQYTVSDDG